MSNQIFPSLKGFDIKVSRKPVYSTLIQPAASGKELRGSFQSYPRYAYALQLNFVRQAGFSAKTIYDEAGTLQRFFAAHLGSWDSFLFVDPYDNADTAMGFGVGDGVTTAFQMQRVEPGQYTNVIGTFQVSSTPRTNLCLQSQTLATAPWAGGVTVTANATTAPDGTPTGNNIAKPATAFLSDYQAITLPTGVFTVSAFVKAGSLTSASLGIIVGATDCRTIFNLSTMAIAQSTNAGLISNTITPIGNGWYRLSITANVTAGSGFVYIYPDNLNNAVAGNVYAWGFQVETGSTASDYIPTVAAAVTANPKYWPLSGDGFEPITEPAPGLQVSRQDWQGNQLMYQTPRTNLQPHSQDVTSWSPSNAGTGVAPVLTLNAGTAPDGTSTATRLQATQGTGTTTGDYSLGSSPATAALAPGQPFVLSVWLKSNTGSSQTIYLGGTVAVGQALTITTSWQRFSIPFTGAAGIFSIYAGLRGTFTASSSTLDALMWGAQIEAGSAPTSYIPTTTTAVTRTDYTQGANGSITFSVAPVAGAALTWTGSYFRRCRFDQDDAEMERMLNGAWDGKTLKLITVK